MRDNGSLVAALKYTGVGLQFIGEAGALAMAGWWLDRQLGWAPWLLVAGALGGVLLATINLVKSMQRLEKLERRRSDQSKDGSRRP